MTERVEIPAAALADSGRIWVETLYRMYSSRVYRFMYYRLGCREAAEDLTALVFQRVIENRCRYDGRRGSEAVWLFTIARRALIDYTRRSRNTLPLDTLENIADFQSTPQEHAEQEHELLLLGKALRSLGEREIAVLSLKYASELTGAEIAEILGLSEKNVGVILSRARKKLRKQMEEEWK